MIGDPTRPQSARMWDYWLDGQDNYAVDRAAAGVFAEIVPGISRAAKCSRNFQRKLVRYLAAEGVWQFLDIGAGLPGVDNTHEIAQRYAPGARTVYVDHDPVVIAHARALLTSAIDGAVGHVQADARDTAAICDQAAATLDLARPVAVLLLNVLHLFTDDEAQAIIGGLAGRLTAGSHIAVVDLTAEVHGDAVHQAVQAAMGKGAEPIIVRAPARIAHLLDGLELLDPGPVSCSRWRPETLLDHTGEVDLWCAVARTPGRRPGRGRP
ncbi:SAM-dependent methyltransferase [Actinomadura sp. 3N407]|uniref:SAM-dependent methyltransferase n=1 Tax=Actinomadura sp. 3N407 TaxID=3457423 RepID=UPI003FCD454C